MFGFNKTKKEYNIGYKMYCSKQYKEAIPHLQYAAEKGHVEAQFLIGDCYDNGYGIAEDVDKAMEWYERAGNQGHAEAQYRLGMMYADVMDMLGIAQYNAEMSDPNKKAKVGDEMFDGMISVLTKWANDPNASDGFNKDYDEVSAKAKRWLYMAAKQGHKKAQEEYKAHFD